MAGGLRLTEPAGDLAIAAAIASSVYDIALPRGAVFIGRTGARRGDTSGVLAERRIAEAAQLGMSVAFVGTRGVPHDPERRCDFGS
jgi:DNA repair protein RadA/Sms